MAFDSYQKTQVNRYNQLINLLKIHTGADEKNRYLTFSACITERKFALF
jgi:hypothetical protein